MIAAPLADEGAFEIWQFSAEQGVVVAWPEMVATKMPITKASSEFGRDILLGPRFGDMS